MGEHRHSSGRHRAPAAGRRRAEPARRRAAAPTPRYRRLAAALGASVSVTTLAVVGGFGLLPSSPDQSDAASIAGAIERPDVASQPDDTNAGVSRSAGRTTATGLADADGRTRIAALTESTGLPAGSGSGRRVVFSETLQRVWLVDDGDEGDRVVRTYLVSGSIYDNLEPGTYEVFSRSRNAWGIDDSGTMEYFVRFTYGDEGAAIGFHTIPVDDGRRVQTLRELGTPLSHGCIRQARGDAIALWDFAPLGTTVVVTA